jgi:hypothetical protein
MKPRGGRGVEHMRLPKRTQYKHCRKRYRVTNWRDYDRSLCMRGDLTIWVSDSEHDVDAGYAAERVERMRSKRSTPMDFLTAALCNNAAQIPARSWRARSFFRNQGA